MGSVKDFFGNWFGYSRRERRSTFILLNIIVIILALRYVIPAQNISLNEIPVELLENTIDTVIKTVETKAESEQKQVRSAYIKRKPLDLSSCDTASLVALPGIGPVLSVRIIKYRNSTGPVTKDTFLQVGMKEQDIQHLLKYITGLTADTVKPKVIYRSRNEYEKAQKEIFKKLLTIGLTASAALELSEMAVKGQEQKIRNKVNGLPAIDADKKKKILKLCSDPF